MLRSMQLRFAAIALFAVAAVSLTAASARAFSLESGGAGIADPDQQVNIFGYGVTTIRFEWFGAQRDRLNAFKHFQSNGLTTPPAPLSRPHD
jgi:hypothetical protein